MEDNLGHIELSSYLVTHSAEDKKDFDGYALQGGSIIEKGLEDARFTNCTFVECDFTGVELRKLHLNNCEFVNCTYGDVPLIVDNCYSLAYDHIIGTLAEEDVTYFLRKAEVVHTVFVPESSKTILYIQYKTTNRVRAIILGKDPARLSNAYMAYRMIAKGVPVLVDDKRGE